MHHYNLDGHTVLLGKNADRLQLLNPLAGYIWKLNQQGEASEGIAADLSREFGVSQKQALQDVDRAISKWTNELSMAPRPYQQRTSVVPPIGLYSRWCPVVETVFALPRFAVRVRYDSRKIANCLGSILDHLAVDQGNKPDYTIDIVADEKAYMIIVDGRVTEMANSPEEAVVMGFREIVELGCSHEDWLTILHAGGVTWKGQGIVFPSSGGAGKTTLTAALIQQGFGYINDDVIPLERGSNKLISLPVNLCIKPGSWPILQSFYSQLKHLQSFGRNHVSVKYLPPPRAAITSGVCTAKYLILPRRQSGVVATLEEISPIEGLRAIVEGDSLLPRPLKPGDVEALIDWVGSLRCYQLTYDKLLPAVEMIRSGVDSV
jgi:hypothetical protein